jgi:pantetheine-phosphate adenylyltransferase
MLDEFLYTPHISKNMKVCIGGTFNILHKGHKTLLNKAFKTAGENGEVFIGVVRGELLKDKKFVKPFNERVDSIENYLHSKGYNKHTVSPIFDIYGNAVDGDFDAIIVSPGSFKNAEEINKKRASKNKKPLKIIKIPYVLAEDGKPISSTRIYDKFIDKEGRVLK